MSMHSDRIQELEHGLAAAYRSLIYAKHRHGAQGGEEEEEEEEGEVEVHLPHVLLKILSYLPLPDLYRMSGISRTWKELLLDDRMWDALSPDAEARKSSPWILVVDPDNQFKFVNIHSNKRATSVETPEKMCGAPYTYKISIQEPPADQRHRPKIGPSFTRGYGISKSRNEVIFSPDVTVYSSVNPSPSGTTPRTSDYPENITWEFVYPQPGLNNGFRTWDPMMFKLKIYHVENQACDCVNKHSMSRTLMPLFPERPRYVLPRQTIHDHSSLMGSHQQDISCIKKMVREDFRRNLLKFHHEELVASCNGIVCFLVTQQGGYTQSGGIGLRHKVLVINPLTGASRELPDSPPWTTDEEQGSYYLRGLRLTMTSTSTGSGYLVILHSAIIGPMLVYNSESNVWTFHKSYNTITTTSLSPFRCKCYVFFKTNDTLKQLSGFDPETGVAYELDPRAMPLELLGETTCNFDSFIYRNDAITQPWSRLFVIEGRIIYVAPLVFDMQQRGYVVCITHRKSPRIMLQGFGVWELREDSHENIRFVELSRTPRELWQRVKLLQHMRGVRTTFVHSFCATKGSICCTTMSYLLEQRLPYNEDFPASAVFPLRSTIPPLVYDLGTNAWSSLPLNSTCVALCGVEPSPWAKV